MANVTIDVVSEFRGKPAFDKAGKSVSALEKSVAKLGKQFLGLFAAQKILAFGKASVKAFAADEAAASQLANTVKNLGLAFAAPSVESYVQNLQQATGVIDDQLRPAMQGLLTTTGSVIKSQELLAQAIDVSRGSGVDLLTVSNDLAQAYVGNLKGLRKYKLGLTQAELKASSFADIQAKLTQQFSGASAAYLETYGGKLEKLTTAFANAKENIGKGILDGLTALGGEGATNIDTATTAMNDFSIKIGNAVYGLGVLIGKLNDGGNSPKWLDKLTSLVTFGAGGAIFDKLSSIGAKATAQKNQGFSFFGSPMEQTQKKRNAAAQAKAEKDAAKRAKDLAAAQAKQTKALKDQALLKKQSALFDLQQVQIVAALQGKLSDEDRKRAELQLALLQGNEDKAAKLSTELANSIDKTGNLAKYLQTLPDANNPFKSWDAYLTAIEERVKKLNLGGSAGSAGQTNTNTIDDMSSLGIGGGTSGSLDAKLGLRDTPTQVNLVVGGKNLASVLLDESLSGNKAYIERKTGSLDW